MLGSHFEVRGWFRYFSTSRCRISRESKRIWSGTGTARKAFRDDGPSGIFNGRVAHASKPGEERRLARTRPAGDDDMRH